MPIKIFATQPPAADAVYPSKAANPTMRDAFFAALSIKPGDNVAEHRFFKTKDEYDNYLISFAREHKELKALQPTLDDMALSNHEKAEQVKQAIFGVPIHVPGGCTALTFKAATQSTINGASAMMGTYVATIGDDEAGRQFAASFPQGSFIPKAVAGKTFEVDVIPFQKDRIDIAPHYNDATGDYLKPEHFTKEDIKDSKIVLFGGYSYYGKHWRENLDKLTSLVEGEPEKKRPLLVMSFSSTDIAGRADFRDAVTASLRRTPSLLNGNMDELALFLGVESGPKLLSKAQEFLQKIEQETGIKNEMFITNGKHGSCAVTTEGVQNFLSMHVSKDKIVETNGAGAAALGGYLYGRALDLTRGESATLSQAFSAAVIQQNEGQISPERKHIYKFWGKSITATGPLATLPDTPESFKLIKKIEEKSRELGA